MDFLNKFKQTTKISAIIDFIQLFLKNKYNFFVSWIITYYKKYNNFWCVASSIAIPILILVIGIRFYYHKLDGITVWLIGLFISAIIGTYKVHNDKDKKNESIFKARSQCFDDLRNIVAKLYFHSNSRENFDAEKREIIEQANKLYKNAGLCYGNQSRTFLFIDQVRTAIIDYLHGTNESVGTQLRTNYVEANEFLNPFLKQIEFLNERKKFELDMFKPEKFDSKWGNG